MLKEKVEQSLKIIKNLYKPEKENIIAFSGGKDSIVIWHLAQLSGLEFTYIHANTTIDPPGHLGFVRANYTNVQIVNPKYSFYQLIERRGLPTRMSRFCCQELKEYIGNKSNIFEGLRKDEGVKRGLRLSLLKEPEQCDTRIKGKIHVYPILNWTEKDVWEYIHLNNLPYPKLYDEGFARMGCVGCPLVNQAQRIKEYKLYPKYVYAVIKAIDKNIKAGRSLSKFFSNPYEAFYWWLSGKPIKQHKELTLFKINYEEIIKKTFSFV